MKGILKLNEKNQYYIWDKENTGTHDLSRLIDTYRNDKVVVHIKDGYDYKIKNFISDVYITGYIVSQKVGKQLYDDYIVYNEQSLEKANNDDIEGILISNKFNLTDYLFNNVDEMIEIDIKIAKDTESEVER